ncbi:MAG TPA: replication initiator, partial [Jatrophihabitantaceae bacterium]|nr:replication initiator [Jatrophihabitantaceae bacterium]
DPAAPQGWPSTEMMQAVAVEVGACVHPIMQRLIDATTGEAQTVAIPCGATWAGHCPPCAERNRKLRATQCREGWHLDQDPIPPEDDQQRDDQEDEDDQAEDDPARRVRSTRRLDDVPDLPRLPVEARSLGREFTGRDGRTYRPSMFVTITMPSYGQVLTDGTARDPDSYDYRRQALDAMYFGKLFDRIIQNLRRAVGYRVQYFAAVEPQKRLAPHVHVAIRGAIPRSVLRRVLAATYANVWWPPIDEPVYTDPARLPVWDVDDFGVGRFVDPTTGTPLPSWDEALRAVDEDATVAPMHTLRAGPRHDIQGLIAGQQADQAIGYLTKYLTKSIAEGITDDEPSVRQRTHADRLAHEARWLPCSPQCANWLRYGITPKHPHGRMTPGHCDKRAHLPERCGYGGRRVLVSRHWTGKTLTEHSADRREAVRVVLEAAGIELPDGHSATELREDGEPRWLYQPVNPGELHGEEYRQALVASVQQRVAWRDQYQRARDGTGPPDTTSHSATAAKGSDSG